MLLRLAAVTLLLTTSLALAGDQKMVPPPTWPAIAKSVAIDRRFHAERYISQAKALEQEWSQVRFGRVVGKKKGQRNGVDTSVTPAEFESREIKIEYLAKLKRLAEECREVAAYYERPDSPHLPELDLWIRRESAVCPQPGEFGVLPSPRTTAISHPDVRGTASRYPLKVISSRDDGLTAVVAEVGAYPAVMREGVVVGYYFLSGWPELSAKVTDDRIHELSGFCYIAGTVTTRLDDGSTLAAPIVQRMADTDDALRRIREHAPTIQRSELAPNDPQQ